MELITPQKIQEATERYSKALINDLVAKQKIEKSQVEQIKTHKEVVMAWEELQAMRRGQ